MIDVSVIVVCYNEEENIGPCLDSLVAQEYPETRFEIIVRDGGSTDRTWEIVMGYANRDARVRLVEDGRREIAAGRNLGVEKARFPHVAFIDADCVAPQEWLRRLAEAFERLHGVDPRVAAVGGTNIPPEDSHSFVRAIGVALDSFGGSFNSTQGRRFSGEREVESLPNLNVLYCKRAIIEIGGYDESLANMGEDADLNFRLRSQGYRLMFIPDLPVQHKFRSTPWCWLKNMFYYGRGRARLLKRHPSMWNVSFALPLLFLAGMAGLILIPLHPVFGLSALYFPLILFYGAVLCQQHHRSWRLIPLVWLVFVIQHFGYALGESSGLLDPRVK